MLLFDQNLSFRLCKRLADVFLESRHVRWLDLDQASDDNIWRYAKENGLRMVTQDSDFVERSRLYGAPPKVVWLRCENATPQQVEDILRKNSILIFELLENPTLDWLEII